ncbi:MAG: hypothetical protein ACE5EC_01175 [Phycisphaerae bacterium]
MILAEIGKFIGAKIAGVLITVAMLAGGWWCYENWDTVTAFGHVIKLILFWLILVAALPWASFLFMRPLLDFQSRMQSEKAAAAVSVGLIAAFCLIDVLLALKLAGWGFGGGFTWFVVILGFLAAGAYNFVICESLARQADA